MKKILIIYKSNTGFTKKYVDWISERVPCEKIALDEINNHDINDYTIIVYGAGMHAGKIQGLSNFKKIVQKYNHKKIIFFSTGAAPSETEIISQIKKNNFTEDELQDIEFYYFQSGLNYEKMKLSDKAIMKAYSKILELKRDKSNIEKGTQNAISKSHDYSNVEAIEHITEYLSKLLEMPKNQ
ncbi:menaquinone-dependent protoporphyrinogen IX oxidase [Acetoanaerobium pronyense]|uniref:Menaquinone-dependent protoporphyrinogen IX oxidase n=1 Tax=Acetoanaerobium pronyense TaxID=1482736 RepID=A0ABS4KPN4_9FIRM|nr:flavodoxin domain-containing protein [Acetoanaerobium pronyense]MBP2028579.1 menaquinone-dependent protoporphyrinogen IX oxidase [Acetoanaerobium pronyense]